MSSIIRVLDPSRTILIAVLAIVLQGGGARAQGYRLQAGDVLEFSILGANAISPRLPVDLGGQINIPLSDRFDVAGQTLEELRGEVTERLEVGSFPLGTDGDGRIVWGAISPEAIVLNIAEYRLIFILGDISTPSAQPFRPGNTVRQAVSVAGGASPFRLRQDPALELLGARDQQRILMAREAAGLLELARLQAEIDGTGTPAPETVRENGLEAGEREALRLIEQMTFDTREHRFVERRNTIAKGTETTETHSRLPAESQRNLMEKNGLYRQEFDRVQGLYSQGLVQVGRLDEAQRLIFLVSSRALDISSEITRLDRELVELRRAYEDAAADHRLQNLLDQKEVSLTLLATRTELERLRQRLEFFQPRDVEPTIEIVRNDRTEMRTIPATLDTALMPGDTIIVRLNNAPSLSSPPANVMVPLTDGPAAPPAADR